MANKPVAFFCHNSNAWVYHQLLLTSLTYSLLMKSQVGSSPQRI